MELSGTLESNDPLDFLPVERQYLLKFLWAILHFGIQHSTFRRKIFAIASKIDEMIVEFNRQIDSV